MNYDSVLQSFATEKFFQSLGYETEVIDYISDKETVRGRVKFFSNNYTKNPPKKWIYRIVKFPDVSYTENCYQCRYAREERVSDLTLGDSWGSELPTLEKQKGISLVLYQSKKGEEMLRASDLFLTDVSAEKAIQSNHQLAHPSPKPPLRMKFFRGIEKGKKFNTVVFRCYPKQCVKQKGMPVYEVQYGKS